MIGMIGVIAPSGFSVHFRNPKQVLNCPDGHAKRPDFRAVPVTDSHQFSCVRVNVDVVLDEIDMIGHKAPFDGHDLRQAWNELL